MTAAFQRYGPVGSREECELGKWVIPLRIHRDVTKTLDELLDVLAPDPGGLDYP